MMALMVDPYWSTNQHTLVNGTVVTVILMTYLCGCTGPFFLNLMKVPMNVPQEDGTLYMEGTVGARSLEAMHRWLANLLAPAKDAYQDEEEWEERS